MYFAQLPSVRSLIGAMASFVELNVLQKPWYKTELLAERYLI